MPYAAPYPCPRHPNILVQRGEKCPKCPVHNWTDDKIRGNRHERGYGNYWNKLRLQILFRDDYLCQPCLRSGRITVAKEVDHIIPKSQSGTDSPDNLQAICKECHREKTAKESARS